MTVLSPRLQCGDSSGASQTTASYPMSAKSGLWQRGDMQAPMPCARHAHAMCTPRTRMLLANLSCPAVGAWARSPRSISRSQWAAWENRVRAVLRLSLPASGVV